MIEFTGERVIPGQVDADLWNEHLARYEFASRFAAGRRVLDAGCGSGYGSARLAETAASLLGADVSSDAISYAQEHSQAANVRFIEASCEALPVASGSIDFVVSFEVVEHLANWPSFLDEVQRVLSPDGLLVISTPNRDYYADSRKITGPNPYHVHEFSFSEFTDTLKVRFPHVSMYLENHIAAIGFQPVQHAPATVPDTRLCAAAPDTASAHFFVALCGKAPLPEPQSFIYVPTTANVLREREQHIEKLETDVARLRQEKQDLVDMFRQQKTELDRSNAWAKELEKELDEKGKELVRCVSLLDTAEKTVIERTEWARELEAKLERIRNSPAVKLARKLGIGANLLGN